MKFAIAYVVGDTVEHDKCVEGMVVTPYNNHSVVTVPVQLLSPSVHSTRTHHKGTDMQLTLV